MVSIYIAGPLDQSIDAHTRRSVRPPSPPPIPICIHIHVHTRPAPPCQSDLDIVPEVVALAQVTSEDVRGLVMLDDVELRPPAWVGGQGARWAST